MTRPTDASFAGSILDGMQAGMIVIDRDFRIREVNRFLASWLKHDKDELRGKLCHAVIHGRDEVCHDCPSATTFKTGRPASVLHTGIDAEGAITRAKISTQPILDDQGNVAWVLESAADVSDRFKADQELVALSDSLRVSEAELRRRSNELDAFSAILRSLSTSLELSEVLEGILDGAFLLADQDAKGGIFLLDETTSELRLMAHRGVDEAFVARERTLQLGECLCGVAAQTGEIVVSACSAEDARHTRPGGSPHGHVIVPLRSRNRVVGVLFLYVAEGHRMDAARRRLFELISAQAGVAIENAQLHRRTDTQLQRQVGQLTQALSTIEREQARTLASERMKDDLMAMISHDLRSPLTVISFAAEAFAESGQLNADECAENAEAIQRAVKSMKTMIENLMASARFEAGKVELRRERFSVGALVSELVDRAFPPALRRRIEFTSTTDQSDFTGDVQWIERVVLNLVHNACKFSPAESPVRVSLVAAGNELLIAVADEGPGVSAEERPHLFDRFYRSSNARLVQGSGLGLYIARMAIEAHGGRIWVESEPGKGATFRFALPRQATPVR